MTRHRSPRRRTHRCRCRSRKRRFRDRIAAELALARIHHPATTDRAKTPVRAYPCAHCRGWHLTSQTGRTTPAEAPRTTVPTAQAARKGPRP